MKKITVEVWSDFVCPWCWIAKKRLEKAIDALGHEVEIIPRAYRLANGLNPIPFSQALVQKTGSKAQAEVFMKAVQVNASLEGLDYQFDGMRFGDTTAAHQYVKTISDPPLQARFIERLYLAGTTEGKDIFNEQILRDLAREVGVPDLHGLDSAEAAIRSDEAAVNRFGTGIPLFVINGNRHIAGAQDSAVFTKALRAAVEELLSDDDALSATSCSISGCTA
ncbi:DsbA family oxidoreductase [Pseudomonas sp. GM67]|uniref:DsbA family oxidoreductase n=1 Tax=Pseudomonas sp. GM67 TaxID=1144335 RepID=UPI0002705CAB|nr:DsbA family oxidoreductase [Pseudomonas sp. GM67]EJM84814.1 putative dithiol-disulfide isomerase involved in polyketide biosynthesis [Pseudomonas sp. GM67]